MLSHERSPASRRDVLVAIELHEIGGQGRHGFLVVDGDGIVKAFLLDERRLGWHRVWQWRDSELGEGVRVGPGPRLGVTPETFQARLDAGPRP